MLLGSLGGCGKSTTWIDSVPKIGKYVGQENVRINSRPCNTVDREDSEACKRLDGSLLSESDLSPLNRIPSSLASSTLASTFVSSLLHHYFCPLSYWIDILSIIQNLNNISFLKRNKQKSLVLTFLPKLLANFCLTQLKVSIFSLLL